jgi:hypothetical protein
LATACAALVVCWPALRASAAPARFSAREIQATYLYKYARFVKWPQRSFPTAGTPITIGLVGEDPFGALLDKLVEGQKVEGRSFQVKRFRRLEELTPCHILFVASSEKGRWRAIQEKLNDAPVLTVADFEGFAQSGGIINFIIEDATVRFEINQAAAERVGLKINATLLNLGRPV